MVVFFGRVFCSFNAVAFGEISGFRVPFRKGLFTLKFITLPASHTLGEHIYVYIRVGKEILVYRASTMNSFSNEIPRKEKNESLTEKTAHSTVTCLYQTQIAGFLRNVTIMWSKNFMNYTLSITVESINSDRFYVCKIDLKPWHFWAKKGYKSFEVDGNQLDAYWDFRSAKFSGSPEPFADFYVALVSEDEVVLLLGDNKKKAYKKTKSRPALADPVLVYKKEHVFGRKTFSTRAKFDQLKRDHDIIVESSISGSREPEMWIIINGIVLIHVKNLQWKFRGNETVLVDQQPVQVFWDVHPWLFSPPGSNYGLFIFKPGAPETETDVGDEIQGNEIQGDESDCSSHAKSYSTPSNSSTSQFCLFLFAWKIE